VCGPWTIFDIPSEEDGDRTIEGKIFQLDFERLEIGGKIFQTLFKYPNSISYLSAILIFETISSNTF
jgi:hypothetical protein